MNTPTTAACQNVKSVALKSSLALNPQSFQKNAAITPNVAATTAARSITPKKNPMPFAASSALIS